VATRNRPLEILVIENNPADARLTIETFKEVGVNDGILCIPDGDQALAYLRQEGAHSGASLPHLIFLDLNLPKKPGLAVLAEIKNNPKLKVIPVAVVSGSNDPREIREAYELHANCFIYKPANLNQFIRFIRSCYEFWGTVVTLPPM
jgi:chemotaxis family two-component system response regulator Rcp1